MSTKPKLSETDLQRACERMVQNEVLICCNALVSTLAHACGTFHRAGEETWPLLDLTEQAAELSYPVLDYEEAAIQANFLHDENGWTDGEGNNYATAEEICSARDVDPYDREVFEHWAVTSWLADKLEAAGERVDRDFCGWNVWARTTTGQAISMDGVIRSIVEAAQYALG